MVLQLEREREREREMLAGSSYAEFAHNVHYGTLQLLKLILIAIRDILVMYCDHYKSFQTSNLPGEAQV